ncbi:MAG: ATP-binding protein, partial [Myxococcales bacterium]|nr:ATP-binding protein [Myxococcales bacterium]
MVARDAARPAISEIQPPSNFAITLTWLAEVLAIEEGERQKRSLERRLKSSGVAAFKPMADFDWSWPKKIDREAVDELFSLSFLTTGHNAVLVGP